MHADKASNNDKMYSSCSAKGLNSKAFYRLFHEPGRITATAVLPYRDLEHGTVFLLTFEPYTFLSKHSDINWRHFCLQCDCRLSALAALRDFALYKCILNNNNNNNNNNPSCTVSNFIGATTGGSGVRTSRKFGWAPNFLHSFLMNTVWLCNRLHQTGWTCLIFSVEGQ